MCKSKRPPGAVFVFGKGGEGMKGCYKYYCLNHDREWPGNCREEGGMRSLEGLCSHYVSAESLMRTFRCGCHRNARGRWVGDRVTVLR